MSSPTAGQPPNTIIENVVRRDRIVVLAGLAGLILLAWVYTIYEARSAGGLDLSMCVALLQGAGMGLYRIPTAVSDVDDYDGRYDAALGLVEGAHVRRHDKAERGGRRDEDDRNIRRGVSRRMDRVQHAGLADTAKASRRGPYVADDGNNQRIHRRRRADSGGYLSMDAAQGRVPYEVPHLDAHADGRMARRREGGVRHGAKGRNVLRRVLLDADGYNVRCRGDEPALDRASGGFRARRKNRAERGSLWPRSPGYFSSCTGFGWLAGRLVCEFQGPVTIF